MSAPTCAHRMYSRPSAMVKASSMAGVAPASCKGVWRQAAAAAAAAAQQRHAHTCRGCFSTVCTPHWCLKQHDVSMMCAFSAAHPHATLTWLIAG
jgi:hypothetical protein